MNTLLSIAIVLFCGWLFLTKTWSGRTILNIVKGLVGICKSIFYCTLWMCKKINYMNKRLKDKINKIDKNENENNGKNNVIDFKSYKKAR